MISIFVLPLVLPSRKRGAIPTRGNIFIGSINYTFSALVDPTGYNKAEVGGEDAKRGE